MFGRMRRGAPAPAPAMTAFRDRVAPPSGGIEAAEECEDDDEDMGFALIDEADGAVEDFSASQPAQMQQMAAQMQVSAAALQAPAARAGRGGRTKQTAHKSTGGMAPRKQLASKAARKSAPMVDAFHMDGTEEAGEASESSSSLTDSMHALINLQSFSGAWAMDAELFTILGIAESSVSNDGQDELVMATALAIAWLEKKVPDQEGVWEMVVEKAKAWMKGQGVDVDGLVAKTYGYF